jgi:hypothetical protein
MLPLDREQRFAPPAQHAGVAAVTIGRTRDEDGTPGPGTGFDVEPGSWLADQVAGPITVETGVRYTFRNDTDERALVTTEIHSPDRLSEVLLTLGGPAHDSERSTENPLWRVAIASQLDGNTTFTGQERPGVGVAVDALAPLARAAGYRGAYGKYLQPAFWRDHVEQPPADL